jgi:signal transduction histidine kinase
VLIQAADRIAGYVSVLLLHRTERLERERAARRESIYEALLAAEETGPEEILCQQLSMHYKAESVFFYTLHNGKLECTAQSTNGKDLFRKEAVSDDVLERIASSPQLYFKLNELRESERLEANLATSHGLLNRACIPLSVKRLIGIVDMRWRRDLKRSEHVLSHEFKELSEIAPLIAHICHRFLLKSELREAMRRVDELETRIVNTADAMIAPAKQALHRCNNLDALLEGLENVILKNQDQNLMGANHHEEEIVRRIAEIRSKTMQLPHAMEFLRAGANPPRKRESLKSLVEAAARQFTWDGNIIYVAFVDEELIVNVNRAWIVEAFFNIIDNGIRAIREKGEPGILTIGASVHENKVRVVFKDTGVGLTNEEVQMVMAGSTERKLHRTGVGVPLTRVLLTNQGGELTITSQKDFGSEMIVDLPLCAKENGL